MPATEATIGGIASFAVKVNDNAVSEHFSLYSVVVERQVNRVPLARIVLLDGDPGTADFAASSSATFIPGAPITIEAGYDGKNKLIFKGIITQQSIRINDAIGSSLEVECRDNAIKMTVGRKSLSFAKKKDSDIISSIIGKYPGLSSSVTATTTSWPQQVQYYTTDWDFILTRADVNGMVVTVVDSKITVAAPNTNTTPVLTAAYGDGIYEFTADLNAVSQLGSVKATAWDYKKQETNSAGSGSSLAGPGNLTTKKLAGVIGLSDFMLQTPALVDNTDLTDWCKAQLIKSEFSKICGELRIDGSPLAVPGSYITLAGLGDRFNGDHFMSGVTHTLSSGNWFTEISIGMPPLWFITEPEVMAPPASGLLPGVQGLFTGTVKKIFDDPDTQYRILVQVPLFDNAGEGLWARLSNFYSTSNAGAFFLPEVDDEVVLGFLNEDPRYPVILGSLYSSSKLKPFTGLDPNEKNQFKAIVSRSGIFIKFDDVDKILTISTPANNVMQYSDKDKQISIKDQNGNSIVMSQDGITVKSPKDINIEAQQKVNIKGMQGITVQSSGGDVATSGINIKENANAEYTAQGGATAEVSSGAQLTLKSAMIMIN